MARKLEMVFINAAGKKTTMSIDNAREDITGEEVRGAMDLVVEGSIFITSGGEIVDISSARVVSTDITEIPLE